MRRVVPEQCTRRRARFEIMTLLSVVMPCYNEEERIYESLLLTASAMNGSDFEIIAVNDGSTDFTLKWITRAAKECPHIKVISYPKNRGKGYALIQGFRESKGELVAFFDADLEIHPKHITHFLEIMQKRQVDVVVASGRQRGSKYLFPLHRRLLSYAYHLIVRIFLVPVKHQAGLKLYRREVLARIFYRLVATRYAAEIEQLVLPYIMGYKIVEEPVEIKFKGKKGMQLPDFINCGIETILIWLRYRVLKLSNQERRFKNGKNCVG